MGTNPAACAASVCSGTPRARATPARSAIGCSTPISLFANMIETSTVSGRIAAASDAGVTRPSGRTGRYDTRRPRRARRAQGSRTARCSVSTVTMWFPRSRDASATPFRARLFDSVAPLVKVISRAAAPISSATDARAADTASRARQPNRWCRLAALP